MIWFMTPDLAFPSGRIHMIYSMVAALNRGGIDAAVWHGHADIVYDQFDRGDTPVHHSMQLRLEPGDVLVVTEDGGLWWADLAPEVPTTMLVQSHELMVQNYDLDAALEGRFPGWPQVEATIAVSAHIRATLDAFCEPGLLHFDVPVAIDHTLFAPATKHRKIAFMPRRRHDQLVTMVRMLRREGVLPEGWELLPIDGVPKHEVARMLGESAIFVSGAEREGFGMPGAEAMSAGCLVVGFTGTGGAEYLHDETGVVVHDDDVVRLVDELARCTRAIDAGEPWVAERTTRGRELVVERYAPERLVEAIQRVGAALTAPGAPTRVLEPTVALHRSTRDPRPRPWWDLYIAARKVAGHYRHGRTDRRP